MLEKQQQNQLAKRLFRTMQKGLLTLSKQFSVRLWDVEFFFTMFMN